MNGPSVYTGEIEMNLGQLESMKHQLVQVEGYGNRRFFVVDLVEGLKGKTAELKPIDPPYESLVREPVGKLRRVAPRAREHLDPFQKIVAQGLKQRMEGIQAVFQCNTTFRPFQFRPLLKYLDSSSRRLLIADETGLGKTIETGYILIHEMTTASLGRVLIVCPPHLQYKWKGELWHRFGLRFDIIDSATLLRFLSEAPRRRFRCIVSMDCLRSPLERKKLESILNGKKLDMLIIDEVHHMIGRGGETLRRKLGLALSKASERVIGLTATPVNLEMKDLKRIFDVTCPGLFTEKSFLEELEMNSCLNVLYQILSQNPWKEKETREFSRELETLKREKPGSETRRDSLMHLVEVAERNLGKLLYSEERYLLRKDIRSNNTFYKLFTRSTRAEVGEDRKRIIRTESVALDRTAHRAFQDNRIVTVSERDLFDEIDEFLQRRFSGIHRRQLASCLPAMIELLRNGMRGFNVWVGDRWEEVNVTLTEDDRERCGDLVSKYGLLSKDTKWEKLRGTVRELYETQRAKKVIVFTQWIPTIKYFRQRKQEIPFPSYVISGQDNEYSRLKQMGAFQSEEGYAVLFTTDVMSEGVDLQSADCVINYDLPFNPQKVEQRIGRVDRIGQEAKAVLVINVLVEGSVDDRIQDTLLTRIDEFKRGIGALPDLLSSENGSSALIDEKELIQALAEYEIRQKLLRCDALMAFDQVLDEEIMEAHHEMAGAVFDLKWMALERLMFLILGEKKIACEKIGAESIVFREIDELDIHTLSSLVDIKSRFDVTNELLHALNEERELEIAFKRKGNGLFLPLFHPLMQKAAQICYASFFENLEIDEIPTEIYTVSGKLAGAFRGAKYLVLIELISEERKPRRWVWLSFDAKLQESKRLAVSPLSEIQRFQATGDAKIAPFREDARGCGKRILKTVQESAHAHQSLNETMSEDSLRDSEEKTGERNRLVKIDERTEESRAPSNPVISDSSKGRVVTVFVLE